MPISLTNIEPEKQPKAPGDGFSVVDDEVSEKDDALARLEAQLQAEADKRREERFIWIVVVTLILDIFFLKDSENATLPIVVLILELLILIVVARRLGIDDVVVLLDRILHNVSNKG